MSLKTYSLREGGDANPQIFVPFEGPDPNPSALLAPGDWVKDRSFGGRGMVVGIDDAQITVLWSVEPNHDFSSFVLPLVRRVNYATIAKQLVTVQPMSVPTGGVFYMDYQYPTPPVLDIKCTSGPAWRMMLWRLHRCSTAQIPRLWSSFCSSLRLLSTRKLSTAAASGPNSSSSRGPCPSSSNKS
jgi:major capsid protein Gp23